MNRRLLPTIPALIAMMAALTLLAACGGKAEVAPPAATPVAEGREAPDIEPQTQSLMLGLTSPELNLVTGSSQVTVSGVTSPDASLSVNGRLTLPDAQGRFSINLERARIDPPGAMNPLAIEVIATSITGESETLVRPVVFSDSPDRSGVFGTVMESSPSEVTLQTASGPVTLNVDSETAVRLHAWESPTVTDIATGSLAAVLADGSQALSVLAVPIRPVITRHFTGIMIVPDPMSNPDADETLTLRDGSGSQITANVIAGLEPAAAGGLVTAVLKQDPATGRLTVTGLDGALAAAGRLQEALSLNQVAGTTQSSANMTALRWRLAEHGVRNLSLLVNGGETGADLVTSTAAAESVYASLFSGNRIGVPSADITGMVTSLDGGTGQVTVQPEFGAPVMVKISGDTPVALFGERVRSGQLDLASRVTVRYALSGNEASRVAVLAGNTLSDDASTQLAFTVERGELQGTLLAVAADANIVTILDRASERQISLESAGAVVIRNGTAAKLTQDMEGAGVFVRFDPETYRLLELETMAPLRGEELITGVVHSFVPKVVGGNITIKTKAGRLKSYTHNAATTIRRDGLNVSINEVRTGDLVRPNTRVRTSDGSGEISVLSLKRPEPGVVTGIIRGVAREPDGQARVTVSNIWLELVSLRVSPETPITQQGRALTLADLAVGQEMTLGSFDPVTLVAVGLELGSPVSINRVSRGNARFVR
ncbi:MAG: hypothetical protein O3A93_06425 [Chloroflexi bacterium]|nr:hypothetical protein [Chloroflexota bacterium]PKB59574.1 MAG: hypothetical protein BZY83_01020 [SAR202 cluster bacterium Casp-Chloro-G2]